MEVFVLVAVALLALGIIVARIRQLIKMTQDESEGCSSCQNCSSSSCKEPKH
ncbi:MAG TPA: hypothetical protein GXX58_05170 [Gelria sp.]|jgi:hypothetical protein|nr:hypothetical protein [Gelria sp.]